jgi:hypothetical protein
MMGFHPITIALPQNCSDSLFCRDHPLFLLGWNQSLQVKSPILLVTSIFAGKSPLILDSTPDCLKHIWLSNHYSLLLMFSSFWTNLNKSGTWKVGMTPLTNHNSSVPWHPMLHFPFIPPPSLPPRHPEVSGRWPAQFWQEKWPAKPIKRTITHHQSASNKSFKQFQTMTPQHDKNNELKDRITNNQKQWLKRHGESRKDKRDGEG